MAYGADLDIYVGDARAAYRRMKEAMPLLESNFLLQSVFVRVMTRHIIARAALSAIPSAPEERGALLAEARRMAQRLEREADAWPKALAAEVRAAVANAEGDRTRAIAELRVALTRLESPDGIYGWLARHRLGLLLGGDEGSEQVRAVVETMRAQGIRDPARWLSVYLPGDWS